MALFQGLFLLVLGAGLLIMIYRSLEGGWLPNGSKGFQQGNGVSREDQPFGYWIMFILYGGAGVWAVITAVQILTGHMQPLPLSKPH